MSGQQEAKNTRVKNAQIQIVARPKKNNVMTGHATDVSFWTTQASVPKIVLELSLFCEVSKIRTRNEEGRHRDHSDELVAKRCEQRRRPNCERR